MTTSNYHLIWIEDGNIRYSVGGKKATIKARSDADLERLNAGSTCLVCSATADTFNFGTRSCENCSEFFRKTVIDCSKYSCSTGGKCRVSHENLHQVCPACRMRKCVFNGMNIGAVKAREAATSASSNSATVTPKSLTPMQKPVQKASTPLPKPVVEKKLSVNTTAVAEFREHVNAANTATFSAAVKARDAIARDVQCLVNALIRVAKEMVSKVDEQVIPKQEKFGNVLKQLDELEDAVQADNSNSTEAQRNSINKLNEFLLRNDWAKKAFFVEYSSSKMVNETKQIAQLFGSISASGLALSSVPSKSNTADYFPPVSTLPPGSNSPSTSTSANDAASSAWRNGNSKKSSETSSLNGVRAKESDSTTSTDSSTGKGSRWSKPSDSANEILNRNKAEKLKKGSDNGGTGKRKAVDSSGDSTTRADADEDVPKKKTKKLERIIRSPSPAPTNNNEEEEEEEDDKRARLERLYEKQERKRLRRLEAERRRKEEEKNNAVDGEQSAEKRKEPEKKGEDPRRRDREKSTSAISTQASQQSDHFLAKKAPVLSSSALPNAAESLSVPSKHPTREVSCAMDGEKKSKEKHKENQNIATVKKTCTSHNTAFSSSHPSMKKKEKMHKSDRLPKGLSSPGVKLEQKLLRKYAFRKVVVAVNILDVEATIRRYKDTVITSSLNTTQRSTSSDDTPNISIDSVSKASRPADLTARKSPPLLNFISMDASNSTKVATDMTMLTPSVSGYSTIINAQKIERKRKAASQPFDSGSDNDAADAREIVRKKHEKAASAQPAIDDDVFLRSTAAAANVVEKFL